MSDHFDTLESRAARDRDRDQGTALTASVARALTAPGWAKHLAGVDARAVDSRAALARLPVLRKSDLLALQKDSPPFGGFNATPDSANPDGTPSTGTEFKDESVDAWELGFKQSLLDGRARLSATVYRSELKNLQVTAFNGINFIVGNAAELIVQGVEVEGQWKLTSELEIGLSANYLDHEYASFPGAPCTIAEGALVAVCSKDLTGKRGAYAPEWSGTFYVDFVRSLGANWNLFAHIDVNYKDDMYLGNDLDEALHQDAYVKIDSRIGVMSADGAWNISVFGRNLTDKRTFTSGLDAPLTGGIKAAWVEEPRVLGLQAMYRF